MEKDSVASTRMTIQRMVILEELRKLETHPTADELYQIVRKRLPRISLGTVYRNLEHLAGNKTILKLHIDGNIKRFDGCVEAHHHASCKGCGRIFDVPADAVPEIKPDFQEFLVTGTAVFFEGYCKDCRDPGRIAH